MILEADWTWTGERFESGVQVRIEDGKIAEVGKLGSAERLEGKALLPGMISSHSHAFQRGLRGRGERFPAGAGSFWTWREAMYSLVDRLEPEELRALCLQAFREMRSAGITCVGEFHYLHHGPELRGWAFDEQVLRAASEAGIRIALLQSYYRTGAIGQPLEGGQRRFDGFSPAELWEQVDRIGPLLDPATQTLGASVHSLRAASLEDLRAVYDEARRRDLVFHIHVEEQRREIQDALAYYGRRPMQLLLETLGTATDVTAIHCTHTEAEDMERFLAGGGTVCLCPLTEGNLGDGIPGRISRPCLGTDSNARLSMLEEMRWLEYGQRLRTETRGVRRDHDGQVARVLFEAATVNGAQALGIEAGRIAPGHWADFIAIDLGVPCLAGWEPDTLLDSLVFGAGDEAIAATCVGGRWSYP
ncbi:MAG TPA: formimidoylglutamate deiminase [Thermoanaerobaculia bacterium]|nr:formimidoylglutamate deiminase [Thermoanaerobaculia bacterium]